MKLRAILVPVATSLVLLGACGGGGPGAVEEAEVKAEAAKQLAAEVDQPEPDIDCPSDLPAELDATIECVLSVDGDDATYPVTITVTKVGDDKVDFDAEVGTEPL